MAAFSEQQLQSYLDETLSAESMAQIEQELRSDESLREQLLQVAGMREAGVHSLGEIWRKNRLSCPTRQQLGSYLLGAMDAEQMEYIRFHLEVVGCRLCQANLADLRSQKTEQAQEQRTRRQRYFQTSFGHLSQQSK
ncbi:MAG: hypothetical protein AAGG44_12280 [Planctomycetota bacterium]